MNATLMLAFLLAADPALENPWPRAKVGDTVTYRDTWVRTRPPLANSTIDYTKTVSEKTAESVTVKSGTGEVKINLKEKYDPGSAPAGAKAKSRKLGEGKAKLEFAGKVYECTWISVEVTLELNGKTMVTKGKSWYSKDVPLDGMIKTEIEGDDFKTTIEIVSFAKGN